MKGIRSILIVGKHKECNKALGKAFIRMGCKIDSKKPDAIVCLGGDGTFLFNERKYPGIQKIMIRDKDTIGRCRQNFFDGMITRLMKGDFKVEKHFKLEAEIETRAGKKKLLCANDFVIRNQHPTRALRFCVYVDDKQINCTLIGDGVVVCTGFGSTAYYHAITGKSFKKGIGVAFNNTVQKARPIVAKENSVIRIRTMREKADFTFDNCPKIYTLHNQDVIIRRSREFFCIVKVMI
jgi:NAD kinase